MLEGRGKKLPNKLIQSSDTKLTKEDAPCDKNCLEGRISLGIKVEFVKNIRCLPG